MGSVLQSLITLWESTGIARLFGGDPLFFLKTLAMYLIVGVLVYFAIKKQYEPLLLLPIAVGMLLTNLPGAELFHMDLFINESDPHAKVIIQDVFNKGGLIDLLYLGVKFGIYPSLIFIGIGAMTDFTPLISNPKSIFLGGAAQLGVFAAFCGALLLGFDPQEAAAIGIIGGADGPTAINTTKELAPHLLGAIAIAAYSYMALIPLIQPPFMKLLTTKKERAVEMPALGNVSKLEKVLFPLIVTFIVAMILPDAAQLVGCLMFGNLLNVCGVTDRLSKTAQNGLINVVTIFLGISVGATATAENFLKLETIYIVLLGLTAFVLSTCGGLLGGKIMYKLSGGKINPLIGSAGVSAVPMAARVAQKVGQKENPSNFLLMHAMGPNVAGVIGSAICAGVFLALFR
jgi:oxaloacetate decarboxylase beta subunit